MIVLKKILVPVDFSEASESALKYGRALGAAFGAELHLLHVMEDLLAHAWTAEVYLASLPANIREEVEKDAAERLRKMLTDEERERHRAQFALLTGTPWLEIVRYAKKNEVDLIVMGTHGLGPIAHMLLGSVAEKVVRKAPCGVLIVRQEQHEFVMP